MYFLLLKKQHHKCQQPYFRGNLKPRCPGPAPSYLSVKVRNNSMNANAVRISISTLICGEQSITESISANLGVLSLVSLGNPNCEILSLLLLQQSSSWLAWDLRVEFEPQGLTHPRSLPKALEQPCRWAFLVYNSSVIHFVDHSLP